MNSVGLYFYIKQLENHLTIFRSVFDSLDESQIMFKPTDNSWNSLEVLCHLLDEEREDFRNRISHILLHKDGPMTSINPKSWVKERNYIKQDFNSVKINFYKERWKSIDLLKSFRDLDWSSKYNHPSLGIIDANFYLSNWIAHDLLHIRQLIKLQYDYLISIEKNGLEYAGKWI